MRKTKALALSALMLALGAAHATTLPYKSFDKLVSESEGIMVGTVRQVQSSIDSHREINTFVTFENLKVLGGSYTASGITLRLKGGRVGDEVLSVEGSPKFKQGEHVLMFIQGNGRDLVPLVGWTQGLFRLVPDAATGEMMVADSNGHAVVGVEGNHVLTADRGQEDVHILGAPDTEQLARTTAVDGKVYSKVDGKADAGRTDDGSVSEFISARSIPVTKAISAAAFMNLIKQRIASRPAMATPLRSIEFGQTTPTSETDHFDADERSVDQRDAASRDTHASSVTQEKDAESSHPILPKRLLTPAAENQQ